MQLVLNSGGIKKSEELAASYVEAAVKALDNADDGVYKKALIDLAVYALKRES